MIAVEFNALVMLNDLFINNQSLSSNLLLHRHNDL